VSLASCTKDSQIAFALRVELQQSKYPPTLHGFSLTICRNIVRLSMKLVWQLAITASMLQIKRSSTHAGLKSNRMIPHNAHSNAQRKTQEHTMDFDL
jgi:hypothetical protein